ncbi:MAG: 23S rRNA (guanosine(2251)-2'-O)-methyltransferase RlmB [Desulfobacteraceae bacterium]|nr:23S rRNA (guanosine(2251)-2'-O)-methyltransferase RlmB [Desulfobacteraceae bacterium]
MKDKTDLLFGFHSVYEALRAEKRTFSGILMSRKKTGDRMEKIEILAKERGIRVEMVDPAILDKMTEFSNHQGIAARTSFFPVKSAMDVVDRVGPETSPCFILVMENIEDPHNLGALIRTALSAGVDYLLIPKDRSAGPSSTVSRTSAGAMEHADIYMITNTAALLRALKEKGVWVFGLDADGDRSLFDADLKGPTALVIGGENKGVRPLVKEECDFLLSIPHKGRINSLNASVAGGIAMYEVLRQRNGIPK